MTGGQCGNRNRGFTLLELVVACALLSILLLLATSLQVEARRVNRTIEVNAYRSQLVELAAEVLHYHVGLAGHAGVEARTAELGGPALTIGRGVSQGGSDALAVRYLEERWYQTPLVRALQFDVKRDSKGMWNLYQREEGATRQPVVQEVSSLLVTGFVTPDGERLSGAVPLPLEAVAIELQLGFTWGDSRSLIVALGRPTLIEASER